MLSHAIILEDHTDAREWLLQAVNKAYPEVTTYAVGLLQEGIGLLETVCPQLCLVDLDLPDGSGIDFIAACMQRYPASYCVVTTIFNDDAHLFPALRAGAKGYLLKEYSQQNIAVVLHGILNGEPPLSPAIAAKMIQFFQAQSVQASATPSAVVELTEREIEILRIIAKGYKSSDTASLLGLSYHTVAQHVKNIYGKLGICNRMEAVRAAYRLGLIE